MADREKDRRRFEWLYRRAQYGREPDKEYELALAYRDGRGTPASQSEYIRWLKRAADSGCADALYEMSLYLRNGENGQTYDSEAFISAFRAAEKGHVPALIEIGRMLRDGIGTDRDEKYALGFLTSALRQGHMEVFQEVMDLIDTVLPGDSPKFQYDTVMDMMQCFRDPDSGEAMFEEGWKRFTHYIIESANSGYPPAQTLVADMLKDSDIGDNAMAYYGKAAAQGSGEAGMKLKRLIDGRTAVTDPEALYSLASYFLDDLDSPELVPSAAELLAQSSEQGDPESIARLIELYKSMDEPDFERAAEILLGLLRTDVPDIPEVLTGFIQCHMEELPPELLMCLADAMTDESGRKGRLDLMELYTCAAGKGSAEAAYRAAEIAGTFDENGQGLTDTSVKWYRKAAELGYPRAQYIVGRMTELENGECPEAAGWFMKAAANGDPEGQLRYGMYCEEGEHAKRSYDLAAEMYRGAAESGCAEAMYRLGMMYLNKNGKNGHFSIAYVNLSRAKDSGYPVGEEQLSEALDGVESDPTGREQNMLARAYSTGKELRRSPEKAFRYHSLSAEKGYGDSVYRMGRYHERGEFVRKSEKDAAAFYLRAAEKGDRNALYRMGIAHLEGRIAEKDLGRAISYLMRAADGGHIRALEKLAYMEKMDAVRGEDSEELHRIAERLGRTDVFRDLDSMPYYNREIEK